MTTRTEQWARLRRVTLELEGARSERIVDCWRRRIWAKDDRLGLQLTNDGNGPHKWMWIPNARIITYSVEELEES